MYVKIKSILESCPADVRDTIATAYTKERRRLDALEQLGATQSDTSYLVTETRRHVAPERYQLETAGVLKDGKRRVLFDRRAARAFKRHSFV